MKNAALYNGNINIMVEESLSQFKNQGAKYILQNESSNYELEFAGYTFEGIKVAILQNLNIEEEIVAQQFIKQATMLAWELGYELFISAKSSEILLKYGFQVFQHNNNEIYCTELTWNAFSKVNIEGLHLLS
ncbi:MAG: hypothetical protein ACERKD_00370 [Prolixibacteraceae bacterium]